ncbi:MAG: HIT family protein [Candidatus Paceibacterota bacterium]|jgi:histidine triad (HIT) family protein
MKNKDNTRCVFCEIINGNSEERRITYEDELIVAFPDKNPATKGHTLIIPKQHFKDIFEIPEEILGQIGKMFKVLAKRLCDEHNATGVNIMHASGKDAEQSVFHLHFHVVPRYPEDNLKMWFHSRDKI